MVLVLLAMVAVIGVFICRAWLMLTASREIVNFRGLPASRQPPHVIYLDIYINIQGMSFCHRNSILPFN